MRDVAGGEEFIIVVLMKLVNYPGLSITCNFAYFQLAVLSLCSGFLNGKTAVNMKNFLGKVFSLLLSTETNCRF